MGCLSEVEACNNLSAEDLCCVAPKDDFEREDASICAASDVCPANSSRVVVCTSCLASFILRICRSRSG